MARSMLFLLLNRADFRTGEGFSPPCVDRGKGDRRRNAAVELSIINMISRMLGAVARGFDELKKEKPRTMTWKGSSIKMHSLPIGR